MARASSPNSGGSQFFIMHQDAPHLDKQYAAFGKLTSGIEAVDAICKVKTDRNDRPETDQVIKSIRVDTLGETYPEPKKLPDPFPPLRKTPGQTSLPRSMGVSRFRRGQ